MPIHSFFYFFRQAFGKVSFDKLLGMKVLLKFNIESNKADAFDRAVQLHLLLFKSLLLLE